MPAPSTLTGAWSGAYRYPTSAYPETVFEAQITENAGFFTGTTIEPNLLRPHFGPVVTADIDGVRDGLNVRFNKFLNGSGGMRHVVIYEGVASADLMRVDGRWTIPGDWSGSFFMERQDNGAEEEAALEAEATIRR